MTVIQVLFSDIKKEFTSDIISIESQLETKELSLILNHILGTKQKYKFTIDNKILTTKIDDFLLCNCMETENVIQIVYHLYFESVKYNFEYKNDEMISCAYRLKNLLYFSDYNGHLKEFDVQSREIKIIYQHNFAILKFCMNENNIFMVDDNNCVFDQSGVNIYESKDKILSISANSVYLSFLTINNELFLLKISTNNIQKVEIENLESFDAVYCNDHLQIGSLECGLHQIEYHDINHKETIYEKGITCFTDHRGTMYLGTGKGHIVSLDKEAETLEIPTEIRYIKHILSNQKRIAYSDQYTVIILADSLNFSTHKFTIEDEISALMWFDDILAVTSGSRILFYTIEINQ